jgi:hypothetical protein
MISNLFIYILITVGCSCLWSLSDIFIPVRNYVAKNFPNLFKKMLLCMECSSFWIGFFIAFLINPFPNYFVYKLEVMNILISSICGGIITYLTVRIGNNKEIF